MVFCRFVAYVKILNKNVRDFGQKNHVRDFGQTGRASQQTLGHFSSLREERKL